MKAFIVSVLCTLCVYFFGGEISTTLIGFEFTPIVIISRNKNIKDKTEDK